MPEMEVVGAADQMVAILKTEVVISKNDMRMCESCCPYMHCIGMLL